MLEKYFQLEIWVFELGFKIFHRIEVSQVLKVHIINEIAIAQNGIVKSCLPTFLKSTRKYKAVTVPSRTIILINKDSFFFENLFIKLNANFIAEIIPIFFIHWL